MLRGLATEPLTMFVVRDDLRQFIVVVVLLQLHFNNFEFECLAQDSSWSDMSSLSGETTTTNGFDGRLLSFRQALASLKMKQGLELLFAHFFLSFHRLGYPKRKKADLVLNSTIELFRHVSATPIVHAS